MGSMRSIAPLPSTGNHARRIGWNPASLSRLASQRPRATLPAMMLRQAQSSEPRPLPRFAPVRPGTASRANPALPLPYRPRLRATPHRPSRNVRRYDWIASSGSVVANDPLNRTDPTGLCAEDLCIVEGGVAACLASQACTAGAAAIGAGVVYYGGKFLQVAGNAISQAVRPTTATPTPRANPATRSSSAAPPPPDPNDREKAKDRRARQQQEARDQRAGRSGGEPDTGGSPRNNQAQNRGFDSVVKDQNLTPDQANRLHQEITGQNMNRNEILQRAREMFPK